MDRLQFVMTQNGAAALNSTGDAVLDLFALGGAMRSRTDEDCVELFRLALNQNSEEAIKCLFYLRDVRGGQGERRFFKVCMRAFNDWVVSMGCELRLAVANLIHKIPMYGRWDDLYCFVGTHYEEHMWNAIKFQWYADVRTSGPPSLLAKWLKSENASSKETRELGRKTRIALKLTPKQYRQQLSMLRKRINIVESQMSQNNWGDIEFEKLPSVAGLRYSQAFSRREECADRYMDFIQNKDTKVNAGALYPHDCVGMALKSLLGYESAAVAEIAEKFWKALPDYSSGKDLENILPVVDVSGSMEGLPMNVAIGLGIYLSERNQGYFGNKFITFSEKPTYVDLSPCRSFVSKVQKTSTSDWGYSTNIEAVFNLIKSAALDNPTAKETMPKKLVIISDMEFDAAVRTETEPKTLLRHIREDFRKCGLTMPALIFWNVNAMQNNIPDVQDDYSYVSGFSPVILETFLSGKTGREVMMEKIGSERYKEITLKREGSSL